MTSKEDLLKFIHAADILARTNAKYEEIDIPYDEECSIKKGSAIVKIDDDNGREARKIGATGITIGAIYYSEGGAFYMIKWDNSPFVTSKLDITSTTESKIQQL